MGSVAVLVNLVTTVKGVHVMSRSKYATIASAAMFVAFSFTTVPAF